MNQQTVGCGRIPLLVRRGGCGFNKKAAKPPKRPQTGWSLTSHDSRTHSATWFVSDHPVRSIKGGFAPFFLMSRPPLLKRRGMRPQRHFVNSFTRSEPGGRTPLDACSAEGAKDSAEFDGSFRPYRARSSNDTYPALTRRAIVWRRFNFCTTA